LDSGAGSPLFLIYPIKKIVWFIVRKGTFFLDKKNNNKKASSNPKYIKKSARELHLDKEIITKIKAQCFSTHTNS
jgi:hypothetical protein